MDYIFEQLSDLLLPHLYPQSFVSQTGMHKPRGVLLHGPPGTGKTLIARTIAAMLNTTPKIVCGPEIFNNFLEESEAKVRALFADARHDQETLGNHSKIHVIIFDQLDFICERRTNFNESIRDNIQDNVTTQLFAEIDGIMPLNNIIIIGTTNIVETIEVRLPDDDAGLRILDIYTQELLQSGLMESDVDIEATIRATRGLTGAHIERVVRLAIINAMKRDILSRGRLNISSDEGEELRVCNIDFKNALSTILSAERA